MNIQDIFHQFSLTEEITGCTRHVRIDRDQFAHLCTQLVEQAGVPLSSLYATDDRMMDQTFGVHAIFSCDETHDWVMVSTQLPETDPTYPALTRTVMAAHWYERYAMDMFGIIAVGHPDPRRLVHHENVPQGIYPLRKDFDGKTKMEHANEVYPMHTVEGEGVYQIPVGPIHAGIIEPGHFRFHVAGERIITLEGKLFFTHKGVEKLLEAKTPEQALPYIERLSGDMAASHALAFCQAIEMINDVVVPARGKALRTLLCELERLTMHVHDLSNIAGMGTGYTVIAAQGFRIKERLMRLSERLLGNRFWRDGIALGGVTQDFDETQRMDIRQTVSGVITEMQKLLKMAMQSDGLRERLETTGVLQNATARAYGAVGLPARASGIARDVRVDHPYAAYDASVLQPVVANEGDVYARYWCRIQELDQIQTLIDHVIDASVQTPFQQNFVPKDGEGIGAVESWRGEILTVVRLKGGVLTRCFPRDPSFCNWALFGEIGPGNIVPDFPLCNKSLNLSYSGTDL